MNFLRFSALPVAAASSVKPSSFFGDQRGFCRSLLEGGVFFSLIRT